jgi:transglutaminase-like putative cysteine protease
MTVSRWVVISPHAPDGARQRSCSTTIVPQGCTGTHTRISDIRYQRPLARFSTDVTNWALGHYLSFEIHHAVTLLRSALVPGPPTMSAPALTSEELRRYLAVLPHIDWRDKTFQSWLASSGLRFDGSERDIAFAYRVFSYILSHVTYGSPLNDDRHPSVTCQSPRGDCGAISLLYVAALRANGVPARTVWGRWALNQTDPNYGQ